LRRPPCLAFYDRAPYIVGPNTRPSERAAVSEMHGSPVGIIYLLKRAELAVRSCVEVALVEFDLTPTQFLTLLRVRDASDLSAAALAREIGVRPQSIIEIVAPLERKKLLKREASRDNQRILHMRLTGAGRRLLSQAMQVGAKLEAQLLEGLEGRQLSVLQEALTRLWATAEKHELHPGSIRAKAQELIRTRLPARQRRSVRARVGAYRE
jgi:DNA-binding MarR family transcriptional regulator